MRKPIPTVIVLALVLAGCGGSSSPSLSAFKSGFAANKQSFHSLGVDLQHAIATAQTKTDAQLASEIGSLATRAKQQAASLSKLNPPPRYKADLQKLESGFRSVASDLGQIATAATKHDATTARSATLSLIHDASVVKAGDTAISSGLHLPAGA
jgi:TolA-binding protein